MRIFWLVLLVVLLGLGGYSYYKDPDGCMKIVDDFGALFVSIAPVKVEIKNGTAIIAPNNFTNTDTPTEAPAPAAPMSAPAPHVIDPDAATNHPPVLPGPAPTLTNTPPAVTSAAATVTNTAPPVTNIAPAITNAPSGVINLVPSVTRATAAMTNIAPVDK